MTIRDADIGALVAFAAMAITLDPLLATIISFDALSSHPMLAVSQLMMRMRTAVSDTERLELREELITAVVCLDALVNIVEH